MRLQRWAACCAFSSGGNNPDPPPRRGSEAARSRVGPHEAAPDKDDEGLALSGTDGCRQASGDRAAAAVAAEEALARRLLGSLRESRPRSHVARHSCWRLALAFFPWAFLAPLPLEVVVATAAGAEASGGWVAAPGSAGPRLSCPRPSFSRAAAVDA